MSEKIFLNFTGEESFETRFSLFDVEMKKKYGDKYNVSKYGDAYSGVIIDKEISVEIKIQSMVVSSNRAKSTVGLRVKIQCGNEKWTQGEDKDRFPVSSVVKHIDGFLNSQNKDVVSDEEFKDSTINDSRFVDSLSINEIEHGIKLICETSSEMRLYQDDQIELVNVLNSLSKLELKISIDYYKSKSGVIIDLRKDALEYLNNGKKLDIEILHKLINNHKKGKENKFKIYSNWFSLFFPLIILARHEPIKEFIDMFSEKLKNDLNLDNVKIKIVDFNGSRKQGCDVLWFAMYNGNNDSQQDSVQLFLRFTAGKVYYAVYDASTKIDLKKRVEKLPSDFNYDKLLDYFRPEINLIINDHNRKNTNSFVIRNQLNSLNTILYGPPGTGKTYNTINKALEIIDANIENRDRAEIKEIFNKKIDEGQIVFTTFHQSLCYEDFIEGIKPLKPEKNTSLNYDIESGIFKRICDEATKNKEEKYVLIIDEINRGNISQIFGELITLIEEDKREGSAEELKVTLPYSKKPFSVPSNLYLIGTMNTADRSIEALDTALRRRFSFEEMPPQSDLIKEDTIPKLNLKQLFITINKRIEKLLDKDHQIGHSYFMAVNSLEELKKTFEKNIIPLLQEYFFGDYGKIGLILGNRFVEVEKKEKSIFAEFTEYDNSNFDTNVIYKIKNIQDCTTDDFVKIYTDTE